ncbi:phosphatase PAP2 family protein [Vibrio breoganii]|uniref:phosphatase PAP2 family protein n=1 Tax=Vibrio breoganii TaxID=553239 RepID=UPI00105458AC|nr:phosphatase PAP2 family protein [Vibrio breoganii]
MSEKLVPFLYLDSLFSGMIITFFLHFACYFIYLAINKSPSPLSELVNIYKKSIFNKKQILSAGFLVSIVTINSSLYTSFKSLIPKINSFSYDLTLANIDRKIHFGFNPWELTHMLFSTPEWSMFISLIYTIWLFAFWWFVCAIVFSLKEFKTKFMIISGFNFIWIINGSILALLFSSAGPCFFEYIDYSEHSGLFISLTNILEEQKLYFESKGYWFGVPATIMQDMLWAAYVEDKTEIGAGISAFPSMHVSVCMYMWLVVREHFKQLSKLLFIFLLLILIGSVHLGWHYAIDGYVSILTTYVIWKFTQRIFNWKRPTCRKNVLSGQGSND